MALKNHKIVNQKEGEDKKLHPGSLRYANKTYVLNAETLTDEQAEELIALKSPYIIKIDNKEIAKAKDS